ncbi:hypothetical protein SAMN05216490_0740 [Mucilaginibacter mallensis]|uniref:Uncharacterized protein n=1 Tax=Mucilaginibacter mallensis TaxID=652787 RepID=A0A1H1QDM0_MUCMA|nr:hypothetical protein SAMN05216490_0740 [Mucilaginibacter mallensis]
MAGAFLFEKLISLLFTAANICMQMLEENLTFSYGIERQI